MAMKFILNSFAHVMGPERTPHAPTLRRTYFEKVISCFDLFFGKSVAQEMYHKEDQDKYIFPRLGLLDYLTLGLGPLIETSFWLGLGFWKSLKAEANTLITQAKQALALTFCGLSLVLGAAFFIMKALFAAAISVFAALFVIPVVHGVSLFLTKKVMQDALQLKNNEHLPLEAVLKTESLSFDEFVRHPEGELVLPGLYRRVPGQSVNYSSKPFFSLSDTSDLTCLAPLAPGRTAETEYKENILADLMDSPVSTPR
jgi:hypothetical protein